MEHSEKKTVALMSISHAMVHIVMTAFPSVMPTLRGAGYSIEWLGRTNFIHRFIFGTGVLPAGFLVDKIGAKKVMLVFLFGASLVASSVIFLKGPGQLLLAMIGIGAFASLYHSSGMTVISYGKKARGRAFGIHGASGTLGEAMTPALCNLIIRGFSWRVAYLFIGLAGLVVATLASAVGIRWRPDRRNPARQEVPQEPEGIATSRLAWFLPTYLLYGLAYTGYISFLPTILSSNIEGGAGLWATAALLAGVPGQWVGGKLADRGGLEKSWTVVLLASIPALLGLWLFRGWLLMAPAVAFAFLYMTAQPVNNSLFARYSAARFRGRIYGIGFFLYFGVGALASQVGGKIAGRYGLQTLFLLLALASGIGGIIALASLVPGKCKARTD